MIIPAVNNAVKVKDICGNVTSQKHTVVKSSYCLKSLKRGTEEMLPNMYFNVWAQNITIYNKEIYPKRDRQTMRAKT